MAQLSGNKLFGALRGLFSCLDTTDDDFVRNNLYRQRVRLSVTDGGTAATAQTETGFWENNTGGNVRVVSARLICPVTGAANASNNLTATVTKRDSAGITPVVVTTVTTDVAGGGFTAFLPKALTNSTVANATVVGNGSTLTALVSKAGTGVAFAAATSQAYIEVLLEPTD